jgi:hypothetical protein
VSKRERVLTVAAALEASLLAYAALAAFLTPTTSSAHHLAAMLVFGMLALPLAWHAVHAAVSSSSLWDPLVLRVFLPNIALLLICLTGAFLGDGATSKVSVALTACAALAMTVGALLVARSRLDAHPALPRTQQ